MIVKFDLGNYKPIKYNYNENQKSYFDWLPNEILQIICNQLSFRKIKYLHLMYPNVKMFEIEYKKLKIPTVDDYNNLIGLISYTIRLDWSAGSDVKGRLQCIIELLHSINYILEKNIEKLKNLMDKQSMNRIERRKIHDLIAKNKSDINNNLGEICAINEEGYQDCCYDGRNIKYYAIPYGGDKQFFKDGPLFEEYKDILDDYKDDI